MSESAKTISKQLEKEIKENPYFYGGTSGDLENSRVQLEKSQKLPFVFTLDTFSYGSEAWPYRLRKGTRDNQYILTLQCYNPPNWDVLSKGKKLNLHVLHFDILFILTPQGLSAKFAHCHLAGNGNCAFDLESKNCSSIDELIELALRHLIKVPVPASSCAWVCTYDLIRNKHTLLEVGHATQFYQADIKRVKEDALRASLKLPGKQASLELPAIPASLTKADGKSNPEKKSDSKDSNTKPTRSPSLLDKLLAQAAQNKLNSHPEPKKSENQQEVKSDALNSQDSKLNQDSVKPSQSQDKPVPVEVKKEPKIKLEVCRGQELGNKLSRIMDELRKENNTLRDKVNRQSNALKLINRDKSKDKYTKESDKLNQLKEDKATCHGMIDHLEKIFRGEVFACDNLIELSTRQDPSSKAKNATLQKHLTDAVAAIEAAYLKLTEDNKAKEGSKSNKEEAPSSNLSDQAPASREHKADEDVLIASPSNDPGSIENAQLFIPGFKLESKRKHEKTREMAAELQSTQRQENATKVEDTKVKEEGRVKKRKKSKEQEQRKEAKNDGDVANGKVEDNPPKTNTPPSELPFAGPPGGLLADGMQAREKSQDEILIDKMVQQKLGRVSGKKYQK